MEITFLGHVSKDVNIAADDKSIVAGGGVFYGSVAVARLGEIAKVYTKCAQEDIPLFDEMISVGVDVHFFDSVSSTSIENVYPTANPDDRRSQVLSLAEPFNENDIRNLHEEILHVNSLWHGEFPEKLIPEIRERTNFLAGDAQGFLRNVKEGKMIYRDWSSKEFYLKYFDLFKVDIRESEILTNSDNIETGLRIIHDMGASIVIGTHQKGVCVYDGKEFYKANFGSWKLKGRTGRGDTCTAAFMVAMSKMNLKDATRFAADVTTRKMQYVGPLKF